MSGTSLKSSQAQVSEACLREVPSASHLDVPKAQQCLSRSRRFCIRCAGLRSNSGGAFGPALLKILVSRWIQWEGTPVCGGHGIGLQEGLSIRMDVNAGLLM